MARFAECLEGDGETRGSLPVLNPIDYCRGFRSCGETTGLPLTAAFINAVMNQLSLDAEQFRNLELQVSGGSLQLVLEGEVLSSISLSLLGLGVPCGAIMLWDFSQGPIPDGWEPMDGQGGRPDWRGRFILAAGDGEIGPAPGATGGSSTHDHGSFTTSDVTLSPGMVPDHKHHVFLPGTANGTGGTATNAPYEASNSGGDTEYSLDFANGAPSVGLTSEPVGLTGEAQPDPTPHNHSVDFPPINHMPPYYAAVYIMRVCGPGIET